MAYIELKDSTKKFKTGDTEIIANDALSFSVEKGELVVILGASGAGKSTLLNILGGMDTNDSGQVIVDDHDISNYSNKQLITYR
ncbi:MAG: ATP-binding cassette domain-containing protein, partial [Tetragenococcus koreensis]